MTTTASMLKVTQIAVRCSGPLQDQRRLEQEENRHKIEHDAEPRRVHAGQKRVGIADRGTPGNAASATGGVMAASVA